MMLVMCPEKVESDCSMDCSSPMSANTLSKQLNSEPDCAGDVQTALRHDN